MAGAFHGLGGDIDDGLAVGGEFEALGAVFEGGDGLLAAVFHGHGYDVVVAAEEQGLVILPHEVELAGVGGSKAVGLAALGGDEVDFGVALVLFHVVVGHGVGDVFAIG